MKLILYNNYSETNKLDKTLVKIIELEGSLLDSTSIINPVIKIFFNPESMDGYVVDDNKIYVTFNGMKITWDSFIYDYVLSANYAYIPEFNRYYFINDIISVRKNIWQLNMNVDVLMSYKDLILNLDAFVTRNEFTYDDNIEDNKRLYYFNQNIEYYDITDSSEIDLDPAVSSSDVTFSINFIQENGSYSDQLSEVTSPVDYLPVITGTGLGKDAFNKNRFINATLVGEIADYIFTNESDASYIISLIAYPFAIPSVLSQEDPLVIGSHTFTGSNTYVGQDYSGSISKYFKLAEIDTNGMFNSYLDYEPYCKYELYLAYYGYVELKSADIKDSVIIVLYSFEWDKGTAIINICNDTKGYVIKSITANIGTPLPINRSNMQQLNDERTQMAIKGVIGTIGAGVGIAAGVGTGNPFMIANAIVGLTSTYADIGAKLATQHERAITANSSSSEGCYGTQKILLKKTYMNPKDPVDYAKLYGKPLNEYCKLNTLKGFTTVGNIHIENIASATKFEHDTIKSLLEEGIIL